MSSPQVRQSDNTRIVGVQPTTPPSDPIPVIDAALATPTAVLNGQVTIAAPRVPLAANPTPIKSVTITSPLTNARVYLGNDAVTAANGDFLEPGMTKSMDIDDLNKVYVTGTLGNVVSYIAVN